jgi:VWFA-related protein
VKLCRTRGGQLRLLATMGLLMLAGPVASQIRTRVELVVVQVTVRDSSGKIVGGLTKDDFFVYEDGKLQEISTFDAEPQPLSAAIVIDDGMSGDKLRRLFPLGSASLFFTLTAGFGPDDRMAAFRYDYEVEKLADFTEDSSVIQRIFDGVEEIAETRPIATPDHLGEKGPGWLRSVLNILGSGTGGTGGPPSQGKSASTPVKSKPGNSSRVLNDALYEAAIALQSQPDNHRKIILLISDGAVQGVNAHSQSQTTDFLVENHIQVFAVAANFATFGSFGVLTTYARATGGDVFPGTSTKSMETAFGKITEQARNQYVLGYVSNNVAIRQILRTIEVKTRTSKYQLVHRKQYTQYPLPR